MGFFEDFMKLLEEAYAECGDKQSAFSDLTGINQRSASELFGKEAKKTGRKKKGFSLSTVARVVDARGAKLMTSSEIEQAKGANSSDDIVASLARKVFKLEEENKKLTHENKAFKEAFELMGRTGDREGEASDMLPAGVPGARGLAI